MTTVFKTFKLTEVDNIPNSIGVYLFEDKNNNYLYIGKSINLKSRIKAHIKAGYSDSKEAKIIENSNKIKICETNDEFSALILEAKLIKKHKPKYNSIWKDSKSYVYITVTNEDLPKIYAVRETDTRKNDYVIGPFSSVRTTEKLLRTIRKIIPFCSQKKLSKKRCFYAKLKLCNPCPNEISNTTDPTLKAMLTKIYKSNIEQIKKLINGNISDLEQEFEQKIKNYSNKLDYEKALNLKNRLNLLQRLKHIRLIEDYSLKTAQSYENLKKFFLEQLKIKKLNRIECYDISNLGSKFTTASMTVMINGAIDKNEYRRFKLTNKKQNDFDNLKNILKRRLKNNWPKPDLIMVDGGAQQIKKAQEAVAEANESINVIGIAKNPDRIIILKDKKHVFKITPRRPYLFALALLRDEAHRFAQSYHKQLRAKEFLKK